MRQTSIARCTEKEEMLLHSDKHWVQLTMDITPWQEIQTTPCTLQDCSSSPSSSAWRFNSSLCTSVFLESEICPGMKSAWSWRLQTRVVCILWCRFSQCACPWKGFIQTCLAKYTPAPTFSQGKDSKPAPTSSSHINTAPKPAWPLTNRED